MGNDISHSPWFRGPKQHRTTDSVYVRDSEAGCEHRLSLGRFDHHECLDIYAKRACLRASPSVVRIASFTDSDDLFWCSGTIIECKKVEGAYKGTVLTTAWLMRSILEKDIAVADNIKVNVSLPDDATYEGQIMAYDLHYNIALVEIQTKAPLVVATLKHLDDCISIDPNDFSVANQDESHLRPHSSAFHLTPGEKVIALGRYHLHPYEIMCRVGVFSIERCDLDCKELLMASCRITICGIGGPLINSCGEVIGIMFYGYPQTPFLPINFVSKWLEHFKHHRAFHRLSLGMEVTNLYAATTDFTDQILQKFPNQFYGVLVEEVFEGSSADSAGIRPDDVIVQCCGKLVKSFLQFAEMMWDKVGEPVELTVIRETDGSQLNLSMVVGEVQSTNFNRWKVPALMMRKIRNRTARIFRESVANC